MKFLATPLLGGPSGVGGDETRCPGLTSSGHCGAKYLTPGLRENIIRR